MTSRPPRRVEAPVLPWESQAPQYARPDVPVPPFPNLVAWDVPAGEVPVPIRCLLYFSKELGFHQQLELTGILNYYPEGSPYGEEPHDVLVLVHPQHRREGIGTALLREALRRWPDIDLTAQRYSREGWALAETLLED